MESVILLFETLGYALDGDVTLNLSLFIELDACLKLSKLGLFALSESALGGSVITVYKIRQVALENVTEPTKYLFWTRRPLASGV